MKKLSHKPPYIMRSMLHSMPHHFFTCSRISNRHSSRYSMQTTHSSFNRNRMTNRSSAISIKKFKCHPSFTRSNIRNSSSLRFNLPNKPNSFSSGNRHRSPISNLMRSIKASLALR